MRAVAPWPPTMIRQEAAMWGVVVAPCFPAVYPRRRSVTVRFPHLLVSEGSSGSDLLRWVLDGSFG